MPTPGTIKYEYGTKNQIKIWLAKGSKSGIEKGGVSDGGQDHVSSPNHSTSNHILPYCDRDSGVGIGSG